MSLEEALTFSGYRVLPSTILLSGMARRQEAHYLCAGKGNFGVFGVMDWCCGTGVEGEDDVMDDVAKEAEKRDVKGRVKRGKRRLSKVARRKHNGGEQEEVEGMESRGGSGSSGSSSNGNGKINGTREVAKGRRSRSRRTRK